MLVVVDSGRSDVEKHVQRQQRENPQKEFSFPFLRSFALTGTS